MAVVSMGGGEAMLMNRWWGKRRLSPCASVAVSGTPCCVDRCVDGHSLAPLPSLHLSPPSISPLPSISPSLHASLLSPDTPVWAAKTR